jgi:hypothetical protein
MYNYIKVLQSGCIDHDYLLVTYTFFIDLCQPGFCMNGGKCAGENYCACAQGFAGDRCNMTGVKVRTKHYAATLLFSMY